ncbi:hypothetical protein [Sphaerisporangium sp. TRM90804]|uniref:hypothetical protein n=1 Tax=Sphaerisporangium sp. TRM90804 TaxID=3031113 RepID=UPI002447EAD3|nr:hypothetical protein [Sphaerisporangium sp. TRM90804]MDH2425727.1 hypothetical protein [Sphaerisporangium sp. TRM90804]
MPTRGGTPGTADDQLSRFVRDYLAEHGESERALAERAVDPQTGFSLQHGWINQLAKGRVSRAPELWRLRALGVAMSVAPRVLAELAAAQWLGVEVARLKDAPDGSWEAVPIPQGLSEKERANFVRIVEEVAAGSREAIQVPPDLSPQERARFLRMAEDIARHMRE